MYISARKKKCDCRRARNALFVFLSFCRPFYFIHSFSCWCADRNRGKDSSSSSSRSTLQGRNDEGKGRKEGRKVGRRRRDHKVAMCARCWCDAMPWPALPLLLCLSMQCFPPTPPSPYFYFFFVLLLTTTYSPTLFVHLLPSHPTQHPFVLTIFQPPPRFFSLSKKSKNLAKKQNCR